MATITHRRCGWIAAEDKNPDNPDDLSNRPGTATFVDNSHFFHAIHPAWYFVKKGGAIQPQPTENDSQIRSAAKAAGTLLWPLIFAHADDIRPILEDPTLRDGHIRDLVNIVQDAAHPYDGIDIDYEDFKDTEDPAHGLDRKTYTTFITKLAKAMNGLSPRKFVSAAVGAVFNNSKLQAKSPYDYATLVGLLDAVHVMTYDLHTENSHVGANCPQWLLEGAIATAQAAGHTGNFVFGLPNYGHAFLGTTAQGIDLPGAPSRCRGGKFTYVDSHDPGCTFRTDWAVAVGAVAGSQPNGRGTDPSTLMNGPVFFDDLKSLRERATIIQRAGFGITYWALGKELPGFIEMLKALFP